MATTTESYKTAIAEYNALLSREMPEVAGAGRADFRPYHQTLALIKRQAAGWVAASRQFGLQQFGAAFVAEVEATLAAEAEVAKQGRIAARAAKAAQARAAAVSNK